MSPPMKEVTASTITSTAATGYHLLKIEGYKMIRNSLGRGKFVESAKFQVAGHTWSILFYPNGKSRSTTSGCTTLCLKLHGPAVVAGGIRAIVRFSMVRHPSAGLRPWLPYKRSYTTSFSVGNMDSCFEFINRDDLESLWYIKDDSFAVRCDITVVGNTAVLEPVLRPVDLERLGMVCSCKDNMCKRHHVVSGTQRLKEAFCKHFFGCFRPKQLSNCDCYLCSVV